MTPHEEPVEVESIDYPISDGRPVAESDLHFQETVDYAVSVLRRHFADEPQVYVAANNFIYYTKGKPADCVSPDVYVVRGVEKRLRDVYKVWEEGGRVPNFVLELTSRSTRREDLREKLKKYRDLGVPEYFLFDPRGEWIKERLRGYRLDAREYRELSKDTGSRLASEQLVLEVGVDSGHIRFYVPGNREPLPTSDELIRRTDEERRRAEDERRKSEDARKKAELRATAAEAELERLRQELKKRSGGT